MLRRGSRWWRGIRDGLTQCSGILSLTGGLNHRRHDRGLFGSLHRLLLSRGVGGGTVGRRGGCSCCSIRSQSCADIAVYVDIAIPLRCWSSVDANKDNCNREKNGASKLHLILNRERERDLLSVVLLNAENDDERTD